MSKMSRELLDSMNRFALENGDFGEATFRSERPGIKARRAAASQL
jgi:hypothetical protein